MSTRSPVRHAVALPKIFVPRHPPAATIGTPETVVLIRSALNVNPLPVSKNPSASSCQNTCDGATATEGPTGSAQTLAGAMTMLKVSNRFDDFIRTLPEFRYRTARVFPRSFVSAYQPT